jgi:Ran GTPase-activating protein (RanGAP) involved in mRNA processing and transport
VETAEAARIHRAGENGVLSAFVRNISEQITKAMRLKAVWDGISEEAMKEWQYVLNTDYDMRREDAQILSVMLQGRQSGEVPKISLFRALKNIELVPEDWDFDAYLEEVEKDAPKFPAREPVEPKSGEDEDEDEEEEEEEAVEK